MSHEADPRSAIRREWDAIAKLALSFDGYEHAGSFDACADIADRVQEQYAYGIELVATEDLRCALFFCQRARRHVGEPPTAESMVYPRALYAELLRRHDEAWIREQSSRARGPR